MQVIGLDSEPVRSDKDEYLLLQKHYLRLQSMRYFRECQYWFLPENNMGMEAAHLRYVHHIMYFYHLY
jgi:hypothetical protein